MENDLIRRSDLLESLGDRPENWTDSDEEIQACADWDAFHGIVTRLPAVDAVEVCRCGQCQFTETDCVDAIYCQRWDRWEMEPDGYCAWGQRREDGDA